MDMTVFHALAQVLQSDLDQKAPDDPESSATIRREGFGQEMEEAEAEQEGSAEGQEQGKLTAQARSATRTSPAPGSRAGTSSIRKPSGGP